MLATVCAARLPGYRLVRRRALFRSSNNPSPNSSSSVSLVVLESLVSSLDDLLLFFELRPPNRFALFSSLLRVSASGSKQVPPYKADSAFCPRSNNALSSSTSAPFLGPGSFSCFFNFSFCFFFFFFSFALLFFSDSSLGGLSSLRSAPFPLLQPSPDPRHT